MQISRIRLSDKTSRLLSRATPSAVPEHSSELIGCPISRSRTTSCACLELRSLPSTGITRFQRYYEPLRHPRAPGLSLAGVQLVITDHALGLPVLRALSLCACCRHYPGAASGGTASLIHPSRVSLPRKGCRVGLRIVLFEACSAFTRVTACTLARSPIRDPLSEGFSHFVTSMTAPVASGWSGCRVGFSPTGKRRLITAHTQSRHSGDDGTLQTAVSAQLIREVYEADPLECPKSRSVKSGPMRVIALSSPPRARGTDRFAYRSENRWLTL